MTNKLSLDGTWDFQFDPQFDKDATPQGEWRSILVPSPWQAQFDDLRNSSGTALYRHRFTVADIPADSAAILHFGAVDYHATVWLNGKQIGEHEGGYLPFEFDVVDSLQAGENELTVKVIDPTDDRATYPEYPFSEIPHGKQSWYGSLSGIWQSVWLEFRPKTNLADLRLVTDPQNGTIAVEVSLSAKPQSSYQIICDVKASDGRKVGYATFDSLQGKIQLDKAHALWSPDSPNLYTVTATLQVDGTPVHSVEKTCGFRTVESRDGRIYLNGKPIYLRGVLDQGYYPETIYTPPSVEFLEDQARSLKALGFNCLRIHIKVEDPHYYDVADRLGLLVWSEIPNWALLTEASIQRANTTFEGILQRDAHHPSIIIWTLINENWGTDLSHNPEHRKWLADFYHHAKRLDPTRLIVDNSACDWNAHVASDLEDFHHYNVLPDHAENWDAWVKEFAERNAPVWYDDYENERRADLPLLVSEFGNWGLPNPDSIHEHGKEPWWFETGFQWDSGIVYPHGVQHRFELSGLAQLFPSYAEFAKHAQAHMARSLQYEISSMRLHPPIAGYIVTEFTDVHWECNGLLTMQRETKHQLDPLLKNVNQDRVAVMRPSRWSGRLGDVIEVQVKTFDETHPEKNGKVVWRTETQSGELATPEATIQLKLDTPGVVTLHTTWLADDGTQLAANQVDVTCVSFSPTPASLRVIDSKPVADALRALGYRVSEGDVSGAKEEIVVAHSYTAELGTYIQNGGRVILLASGDEAMALPVGTITPRAGTPWQGDWANSLAWIRKQGPFTHIPGDPLLEMESAAVMPDAVIANLPTWAQLDHSWAGLTVGWIHKTVSLLSVLPYGRGQIVVSTFKLNATTLANDAIAQALFDGMLKLL
ncbi:MAG: glycoside hydrolase family 2 TIM barrel-domain containing protein [Anaerolineales bacterium]